MNVAKQSGSVDCALYPMAIILSVVFGSDPTELVYNQFELRPHLMESATLHPFPIVKHRKPANKVTKVEKCTVYCYCRLPDDGTV